MTTLPDYGNLFLRLASGGAGSESGRTDDPGKTGQHGDGPSLIGDLLGNDADLISLDDSQHGHNHLNQQHQ